MNYTYRIVREVLNEDAPTKVKSATDAARYLYANCFTSSEMYRESCWALMLNKANEITGQYLVSSGSDNSTIIDKKAVCRVAIGSLACGVILAHNHPSGHCTPSAKDIRETGELKKALDCFQITLLDHIVVTDEDFYSFAEERAYRAPETAKSEPVDIFTPEDIELMNLTLAKA